MKISILNLTSDFYIEVSNISAGNLGTGYEINISKAEETEWKLTYSVLSYVNALVTSENKNEKFDVIICCGGDRNIK